MEDGRPSQEAGGRKALVWEQSEGVLRTWVLVLRNTGLATVDKQHN